MDIGILMDESGSLNKDDFKRQKSFVKALARHFQFGPNAAQFGVITFSTGAQLDITLNRYGDAASFGKGVNRIRHAGIASFYHPLQTISTLPYTYATCSIMQDVFRRAKQSAKSRVIKSTLIETVTNEQPKEITE